MPDIIMARCSPDSGPSLHLRALHDSTACTHSGDARACLLPLPVTSLPAAQQHTAS
jgi:hypothetical protein